MKLLIATDALTPPLTGIGRYTYELLSRFHGNRADYQIEDLIGWQHGRITGVEGVLDHASKPIEFGTNRRATIKERLARQPIAVKLYSVLLEGSGKLFLKQKAKDNYTFHSPNFILPPYSGKLVATIHDLSVLKHPDSHPKARVDFVTKHIMRAKTEADHMITVSNQVRSELIEDLGFLEEKVTAIPLAADHINSSQGEQGAAEICNLFQLDIGEFFLSVATIEPRKNLARVLQAFQTLPDELKRTHPLILVGDAGWNQGELFQTIQNLQSKGYVRYLGFVTDVQLAALYSACLANLYVSIYEGFGLPIIEAQICGAPVITSNVSSMPEVSGGAAVLVDPLNIDEIRAAMLRIVEDRQFAADLHERGRQNALKLSWQDTARRTADIYASLVND